jgi:VanZ family protein
MTAHASNHAQRNARLAWLAALVWTGVILVAGGDLGSFTTGSRFLGPFLRWLLPDAPQATLDHLYIVVREAAHVAEYGVLAVLAARAWRPRIPAVAAHCAAALGCVLLVAAVDEGRQSLQAARTGSLGDVGLDFSGGVLALGIAFAYTRAMHSWRTAQEPR